MKTLNMNMECENRMLYRTIAGADPAGGAPGARPP